MGYPHKIWPYVVQYLHFRILKLQLAIYYNNMGYGLVPGNDEDKIHWLRTSFSILISYYKIYMLLHVHA